MAEEFRSLTLQVITEAILSITPEESDKTFAHMYLPIVEEGNLRTWHPERTYLPNSAFFKHKAAVRTLNDYVVGLINARWDLMQLEKVQAAAAGPGAPDGVSPRRQDILDKVLNSIDPANWTLETVHQVRDEVKTFILAGHETSASMLAWSLYELSVNQDLLKKMQGVAEITYGPDRDIGLTPLPSKDELNEKLEYAEWCLRESLRKYAVVPSVVRVPSCDVTGEGYHIPKGTCVMVNIQGAHHNEKYWPDSHRYDPDRFSRTPEPYTYLPFIDGPRVCLGQFLSLLESKIVLSLLVHRYTFEVVNTEDAGQTHPFMVPIIPKAGHVMRVHKR
jgi:cytochrome P450